jgi:hypothetical protein
VDTDVSEEHTASDYRAAEDEGSVFPPKCCICLQVHKALQLRGPTSTSSRPLEPQIQFNKFSIHVCLLLSRTKRSVTNSADVKLLFSEQCRYGDELQQFSFQFLPPPPFHL